jgi:hypothetical protein
MSNMGGYGKANRFVIKVFGCFTATDTTTVFSAGVLCNERFPSIRAVGIYFANMSGEPPDVFIIELSAAQKRLTTSHLPLRRVGFAFPLSSFEGFAFHKEALSLVAFAGATPFQHHGRKARIFAGTTRESRVA